jgi:hypothetical protein
MPCRSPTDGEADQQQSIDAKTLLTGCHQLSATALSLAEQDAKEQTTAAIFAQVATARAVAALAAAVLEVATSVKAAPSTQESAPFQRS